MKLEITFEGGRWLVNGKRLQDLNQYERIFMDNFFREVKSQQNENNDHHNTYSRVRSRGLCDVQEQQEQLNLKIS